VREGENHRRFVYVSGGGRKLKITDISVNAVKQCWATICTGELENDAWREQASRVHFNKLLHTMSSKAIYQITDKLKQHQSFLTSFARGTPMHEALMSTSTPPSGCKLGLIPGVIMPLQITKNTS
jgi:hypothetical protein